MSRLASIIALVLALASGAEAQNPAAHSRFHGIAVTAYQLSSTLLFCFDAKENTKIAAEYGIEFRVPPSETDFWNERFPKIVTKDQPYFDLPLALELKTLNSSAKRHINVHLGICVDANYCEPIDISIIIPSRVKITADKLCNN